MVLIDSIYINSGGGKILLEYFIKTLIKYKLEKQYFFLFDGRIENNIFSNLDSTSYIVLPPSEKSRKKFYIKEKNKFHKIFCFANVPPPIKILDKPVYIYFHNTLLLDYSLSNLSFIKKIILLIKRNYIISKNSKLYTWIVQTQKISDLISGKLFVTDSRIEVLPLFDIEIFRNCNKSLVENNKNFLYVADSSGQKNHFVLLDSWQAFSKNISHSNVTLHLTLASNSNLCLLKKIDLLKSKGYKIVNHGACSSDEIKELYSKCNFLIYPSLAESFGLPLIEATSAGCKIISSNLPYVYQVIEPSLTFNPHDRKSITNALISTQNNNSLKASKMLVENKIIHLINKLSNV